MEKYEPNIIEPQWQKIWEKAGIYRPDLGLPAGKAGKAKKPFFNLMMFPYPSAEGLHVGNMYAFTGSDIYGRFKRMQGYDVFEPIGLDGFGIHSENYALKVGRHPREQAKVSESNFYRQLRATGNAYDWSRTLETYDPDYYKWTQWIFIQLFKAGLAYRKKSPVNFCPSCKTVLADEQVIEGKCERCKSIVEERELEQWFFAITKYANRLLTNLAKIDWSEKVKTAQRNWIGKKEGAIIKFQISNSKSQIEVFTTRPDTLYGATFLVLAPEHPFVAELLNGGRKEVRDYVEEAKRKTKQERMAEGKEKTGIFSGLDAINPLNDEKIPIWIADYALMEYGTGALFGDAHDERDVAFAKKYGIKLKPTIITGDKQRDAKILNLEECFTGYGRLIDSGQFSGLTSEEAMKKVVELLTQKGMGSAQTTYHLRDWLISRQRYWGPPIPMIYCAACARDGKPFPTPSKRTVLKRGEGTSQMVGWYPVPEEDLPVLLPEVKNWRPKGMGKSPLASVESFVKTKCPKCGGVAARETDVSDTFLDSAWYYLRYPSVGISNIKYQISNERRKNEKFEIRNLKLEIPWNQEITRRWLPVEMYIGGAEHAVLHLLYSRFLAMVFKDLGLIEFEEPFKKFYAHGLLISEGAKMSKSRGNIVIPDAYIKKYGADTLRCYLMFLGPFSQGGDFRDTGIEGMYKFLKRVWKLLSENSENSESQNVRKSDKSDNLKLRNTEYSEFSEQMMHRTIKKVTEDIENLRLNTALAALMEWYNFLVKQEKVSREEIEVFLKLLAPFAPHLTEELYQQLFRNSKFAFRQETCSRQAIRNSKFLSIHLEPWPKYDPKLIEEEEVTIVVQINGKVRDTFQLLVSSLPPKARLANGGKLQSKVEKEARKREKVKKHLEGKVVKKVIYVPGKVINFVLQD